MDTTSIRQRKTLLALLCLFLLAAGAVGVYAQNDEIVLTLVLPDFVRQTVSPELLSRFEAENPGVRVEITGSGFPFFPSAAVSLDEHLNAISDFVSAADVQLINLGGPLIEATRAGYFLDLSPLTSADPALNTGDFAPTAWQSVQWDGGVWALPVAYDLITLIYNAELFDQAGLAYPSSSWTLTDLANAARALTRRSAAGNVEQAGLIIFDPTYQAALFRSLLGSAVYDAVSGAPSFSQPALETLLTEWAALVDEGVVSTTFSGSLQDFPMQIAGTFALAGFSPEGVETANTSALLPGGAAMMNVSGFSVSSGTAYPELAYALARYLTFSPEMANNPLSAAPARSSLSGVEASPAEGGGFLIVRPSGPALEATLEQALPAALPISELLYSGYIGQALSTVLDDDADPRAALQGAEAQAAANLQAAAERRADTMVAVATPVSQAPLAAGEVSLSFGMQSFISPLPNQERWDQVIREFVAADPQVGQIVMDTGLQNSDQFTERYDCFYLPYNLVPQVDVATLLNLDPYLDADPTFDRNDVFSGILTLLQRDNKTWALPIVLQPQALEYHADRFAQAGLPVPEGTWTVDEFNNALRALGVTDGQAPFQPNSFGAAPLLLLMAAYGGLPIDYRTSPATLNFDDAATLSAVQQVLDLAREGYIKYERLAGSGAVFAIANDDGQIVPIRGSLLGGFNIEVTVGGEPENPYRMTTYPTGSQYTGVTFGVGSAYISATSQNPDACYRWLSTLARHPELFSGMAARQSLLNDPTVTASQKPDETAFYNRFSALMNQPTTIVFPSGFAGGEITGFLLERWLGGAFDAYVLDGSDLPAALSDAQVKAQTFLDCIATLPPADPNAPSVNTFDQGQIDCAVTADPSIESFFAGAPG